MLSDEAKRKPIQSDDLFRLRWVQDPQLSPDSLKLAYVLKSVHPDNPEERYLHQLIVLDELEMPDNGVGRSVLPGFDASISQVAWTPNGHQISFVSNRSGISQVWVLNLESGSLRQISRSEQGVKEYDWSPDGQSVAYIAGVPEPTEDFGEYAPGRFRVIRRLAYKSDGSGYWDGTWNQLFLAQLADSCSGEQDRQLTDEQYGVSRACWSSNGKSIAYLSSGDDNPDKSQIRNIYVAEVDDSGDLSNAQQLTESLAVRSFSWSPSNNEVAFIGDDLTDDRATNTGIWICRVADRKVVNLTADIDRPAGDFVTDDMNAEANEAEPIWSDDGSKIVTIMSEKGRSLLASVDFQSDDAFKRGTFRSYADSMSTDPWNNSEFNLRALAHGDHRVFAFSYDGKDRAVVARSDALCPGDLYLISLDTDEEQVRLTDVNREVLQGWSISKPEPISFTGSEDQTIEGWLLKPTNGVEPPYPLLLHIHGGPHSAYSMAFNFELQHLAAQGYAVLFVNPHGSHTYGRRIITGTRLDWGGKDFNDLMLAVDSVLDRPDIDAGRIGVAGGSYGGWMVNYIVTRTNRFKAAIAQRSSSNRISTFLSSMMGYRHQRWEAPGSPWEKHDYFIKISPVLHAGNVETPLLLEHAEEDHLCPLMQAEEMFTALKMQGKPVEIIYFIDESHHMLRTGKPANRVERLNRVAAWFDRYV